MARFIMMVGLVGSGKSTVAKKVYSDVILSSDGIRKELYGDESIQGNPKEVFGLMRQRTIEALKENKTVVYDATNLTPKTRHAIMNDISDFDIEKIALVIATPIEVCKEQNKNRERHVPESVIDRMAKSFKFPLYSEGFTIIRVIYNKEEYKNYYGNAEDTPKEFLDYDQNNPWHPEGSLGIHISQVTNLASRKVTYLPHALIMTYAGYLHDVGKPYCEFKDEDDISHYYGHGSVSALMAMNYNFSISLNDKLKFQVYQIISYHMDAHQWEEEPKAVSKFAMKEPVLADLLIKFVEADKEGAK